VENVHELVDRAVQGDADAFGRLYDRLCANVYRYFYYQLTRHEDAEDLVALTFMRAWQSIAGFRWRERPFEAWLFTLARHQLVDFHRGRRAVSVPLVESLVDGRPGPETVALSNEAAAVARNALLTLTTEQREVLVLKFYLNLETSEIAKIMGKRQGTIRGLQLRALRALRRQLGDE
jgi:RNA polymerase sigma-70 factor, ECF subfamily